MKTYHTPGPWSWTDTGKHWNNDELLNLRVNCGEINHGEVGECICDTVYEKADAQLISAAPELLQVAFKCLEWCNGMQSPEFVNQLRIEAEIAIKKAIDI